jgi:hypothetical protein
MQLRRWWLVPPAVVLLFQHFLAGRRFDGLRHGSCAKRRLHQPIHLGRIHAARRPHRDPASSTIRASCRSFPCYARRGLSGRASRDLSTGGRNAGGRRAGCRAAVAALVFRPSRAGGILRAPLEPAAISRGGVPEWSNGAVSKTDKQRHGVPRLAPSSEDFCGFPAPHRRGCPAPSRPIP